MSLKLEEPRAATPSAMVATPTKSFKTHPTGMLGLWHLRHLIGIMVKRDLLGQYKGSVVGFFWTIINPLGHLLLYTFVFSIILKVKFGASDYPGSFAMYLMAGFLPWSALGESLTRTTSCITEQPNLVKRVVFPLEILPLAVVVSSMISAILGLIILVALVGVFTHQVAATIFFAPLILLSQFMFVAGLSWLVASLGVYIQDLRHMMTLTLQTWMYLTPIIYPMDKFPHSIAFLAWINPMAGMVNDYRRVLLENLPPDWNHYFVYTAMAVAIWSVGYFFFCKTKRSFADVV
jgi:lipopolysaccharide transport system permease protein